MKYNEINHSSFFLSENFLNMFDEIAKNMMLENSQNFIDLCFILYEKKEFLSNDKIVFRGFDILAKSNEIIGLFALGYFYQNGLFVDKDIQKSIEYYQKSADLGDYQSMYNLAIIYGFNSDEQFLNKEKSEELLNECLLKKSDSDVFLLLGRLNKEKKDYFIAEKMFKQASSLNNDQAMYEIGILYKDCFNQIAPYMYFRWILLAARCGNEDAIVFMLEYYKEVNDFEKSLYWVGQLNDYNKAKPHIVSVNRKKILQGLKYRNIKD